jgi:arsenite/tail-anchored protein-transporting ATPase
MSLLLQSTADAPFVFVVGKGGVGKTTAAGALALEIADADAAVHLISTDPAHSLADLFGQPLGGEPVRSDCSPRLLLEEFDADAFAAHWLARAAGPVTEIIEGGTYLDAEDVAGFTRLALPGLDEMMAVLRLVDLARADARVVVDTAPTGHTLRLLDAAATHAAIARALRAMADKAAAVASSLARQAVHLTGEHIIDELEDYAAAFRDRVLDRAAFVIAARSDDVVRAETARLTDALNERRLRVAATVFTGAAPAAADASHAGSRLAVPLLPRAAGCDGLRAWRAALAAQQDGARDEGAAQDEGAARVGGGDAADWLDETGLRLLVFAGKGGVGKSTCAAAAALVLAEARDVLLCSADPAGSLDDVFARAVTVDGSAAPRLRTMQIDASARLDRLREEFHTEIVAALDRIGLSDAASLDRRVIEALWDLAPPGIDEFAALAELLEAADSAETLILDTAPTGHFLRLLTMPDLALDWTRQLMRIIVKYRAAGAAGEAAESLLRTARELRALQQLLHDPARAGVFIVTLEEPLVQAETRRLETVLREAGVAVAAVIVNRAGASAAAVAAAGPVLRAPERRPPPVGAAALREFAGTWKIVT